MDTVRIFRFSELCGEGGDPRSWPSIPRLLVADTHFEISRFSKFSPSVPLPPPHRAPPGFHGPTASHFQAYGDASMYWGGKTLFFRLFSSFGSQNLLKFFFFLGFHIVQLPEPSYGDSYPLITHTVRYCMGQVD